MTVVMVETLFNVIASMICVAIPKNFEVELVGPDETPSRLTCTMPSNAHAFGVSRRSSGLLVASRSLSPAAAHEHSNFWVVAHDDSQR